MQCILKDIAANPYQKGLLSLNTSKRVHQRWYTLKGLWKCNVWYTLARVYQSKRYFNAFMKLINSKKRFMIRYMGLINSFAGFIILHQFFSVRKVRATGLQTYPWPEMFGFCHSIEGEILLRYTNFSPVGSFPSYKKTTFCGPYVFIFQKCRTLSIKQSPSFSPEKGWIHSKLARS